MPIGPGHGRACGRASLLEDADLRLNGRCDADPLGAPVAASPREEGAEIVLCQHCVRVEAALLGGPRVPVHSQPVPEALPVGRELRFGIARVLAVVLPPRGLMQRDERVEHWLVERHCGQPLVQSGVRVLAPGIKADAFGKRLA